MKLDLIAALEDYDAALSKLREAMQTAEAERDEALKRMFDLDYARSYHQNEADRLDKYAREWEEKMDDAISRAITLEEQISQLEDNPPYAVRLARDMGKTST